MNVETLVKWRCRFKVCTSVIRQNSLYDFYWHSATSSLASSYCFVCSVTQPNASKNNLKAIRANSNCFALGNLAKKRDIEQEQNDQRLTRRDSDNLKTDTRFAISGKGCSITRDKAQLAVPGSRWERGRTFLRAASLCPLPYLKSPPRSAVVCYQRIPTLTWITSW